MHTLEILSDSLDMADISRPWWEFDDDQSGQGTSENINVVINSIRKYQEIDGIGGSFSEIGGKCLKMLGADKQLEVLKSLFDTNTGAGFTFCRLPIGASDFGLSPRSLNDHENDYVMEKFSVEKDLDFLIPYVKSALDANPQLKIHSSPWSPPGWLKESKSMVGGGSLIDSPDVYKAYALYLCKFIQEYERQGIAIDRLLVQNEPDAQTKYPSCFMPPDQMVKFVVEYLDPEFKKNKVNAKIWAGTFRTFTGLQAIECMSNAKFRNIVEGVGVQYSCSQYIYDLQKVCDGKSIMHTESVCYDGRNSWEQAVKLYNDFITYMNAGCTVYTYWNMILDNTGMSTWNWKQNSLISINTETGEVIYNPDFYVMKIISSHLKPGARRIETFCIFKQAIAFENIDGSIVVFISNLTDKAEKASFFLNGKEIVRDLSASSINAIVL